MSLFPRLGIDSEVSGGDWRRFLPQVTNWLDIYVGGFDDGGLVSVWMSKGTMGQLCFELDLRQRSFASRILPEAMKDGDEILSARVTYDERIPYGQIMYLGDDKRYVFQVGQQFPVILDERSSQVEEMDDDDFSNLSLARRLAGASRWVQSTGTIVRIADMGVAHALGAVAWLERNADTIVGGLRPSAMFAEAPDDVYEEVSREHSAASKDPLEWLRSQRTYNALLDRALAEIRPR